LPAVHARDLACVAPAVGPPSASAPSAGPETEAEDLSMTLRSPPGNESDGSGAKFSLLGEELDDTSPDEHENFVRSVREFHCTLMRLSQDGDIMTWNPGNEHYISRFAQPCPARPIWAALPPVDDIDVDGFVSRQPWMSDFSCAPLVCVVLQDRYGLKVPVRQALCKLACHPAGLIVNVKAIVVDSAAKGEDHRGQLLFVVVGLSPPTHSEEGQDGTLAGGFLSPAVGGDASPTSAVDAVGYLATEHRRVMSKADQRQVVWAAIHEALGDEEHTLPDLVEDIYMLQDVYLYDRVFRWLTLSGRHCCMPRALSTCELDLLAHEYGEEIATHFLFAAKYIKHLRWAAMVAVPCLVLTILEPKIGKQLPKLVSCVRLLLASFLPVWGAHFVASWVSSASRAGFRWLGSLGPVQHSVKEIARAQAMESWPEKRARYLRVALMSVPLMLLQMLVVLSTTVMFIVCEVYIYDVAWEALSSSARLVAFVLYNTAFGVAFILMLGVFHPISKAVTRCERHPDHIISEWHLTAKIYANWFFAVFLYFFVIAFCYIPFGDNIADFVAATYPFPPPSAHVDAGMDGRRLGGDGASGEYSIQQALRALRPDIHRLAFDVSLFFLCQDCARLMQVLVPVVRAAWGIGQRKGVQPHRQKRTAIFWGALAFCRPRWCLPRRQVAELETEDELTVLSTGSECTERVNSERPPKRPHAMSLVPTKLPERVRKFSDVTDGRAVPVLFILLESVQVLRETDPMTPPKPDAGDITISCLKQHRMAREVAEVVLVACRLEGAAAVGDSEQEYAAELGDNVMTSRIRVCYGSDRRGCLREDADDGVADLITLTCDPAILSTGCGELSISAEVLRDPGDSGRSMASMTSMDSNSPSSWQRAQRVSFACGKFTEGTARTGAVQVRYIIGVVSAPSHHEALDQVPRAVRRARTGLPPEEVYPPADRAAAEESAAMPADGRMPWLWWDAELTESFWDEVFELYTVKESFETFEIFGHLATQFSYVCLFGIAVPLCPLLAWIFTAVEARQDQMRLLWLSRPPHPDKETLRFNRSISLGAWYTIIRFTGRMSVIVNLLLWAITYRGLGDIDPAEWSATDWWRAIAVFLLLQHVYTFICELLHSSVARLDHDTATAYLKRCRKLQQAVQEERSKHRPASFSRQAARDAVRKRFTRCHSRGLSALI